MHIPGIGGHHETVNYSADQNGGWPDTVPGAPSTPQGSSVDTLPSHVETKTEWHVPVREHVEAPDLQEKVEAPANPIVPETVTPSAGFGPSIPLPEAAPAVAVTAPPEHTILPSLETPPSSIAPMTAPAVTEDQHAPSMDEMAAGQRGDASFMDNQAAAHEAAAAATTDEDEKARSLDAAANARDAAFDRRSSADSVDGQGVDPEPTSTEFTPPHDDAAGHADLGLHKFSPLHNVTEIPEQAVETPVAPMPDHALAQTEKQEPSVTPGDVESPLDAGQSSDTLNTLPPAADPVVTNETIESDIRQTAEAANGSAPDSFVDSSKSTEAKPDNEMLEKHRKAQNLMEEARQNLNTLAADINKCLDEMRDANARLDEAQQALNAEM